MTTAYEDPQTLPEVVASCDQRHCYLSCRLGEHFQTQINIISKNTYLKTIKHFQCF
jgi:hypothetical protein